jgi:hypothetical protein
VDKKGASFSASAISGIDRSGNIYPVAASANRFLFCRGYHAHGHGLRDLSSFQQLSAMRRLVLALAGVQFLHVSLAHMFRI